MQLVLGRDSRRPCLKAYILCQVNQFACIKTIWYRTGFPKRLSFFSMQLISKCGCNIIHILYSMWIFFVAAVLKPRHITRMPSNMPSVSGHQWPSLLIWFNLIPAWINPSIIKCGVKIRIHFPNFCSAIVEVRGLIRSFILHFAGRVFTYLRWN